MWITSKHCRIFHRYPQRGHIPRCPAAALSYQTTEKKMWPIWFPFSRGTDWAVWKSQPTHRNRIRRTTCGGDELGKLHNIFIRYSFTSLVDGLQGDTLKIILESWKEKEPWLAQAHTIHYGFNQLNGQWIIVFLFKTQFKQFTSHSLKMTANNLKLSFCFFQKFLPSSSPQLYYL